MIWRVEVKQKDGILDAQGTAIAKDISDLGYSVSQVRVLSIFLLEGDITSKEIKRIGDELLVDSIVEQYSFDLKLPLLSANHHVVEIAYNAGVMDPVESSTIKGIRDLGIKGITAVRTAKQYHIHGKFSPKELESITSRVLMNKLIQHVVLDPSHVPTSFSITSPVISKFDVLIVDLIAANDKKLQ